MTDKNENMPINSLPAIAATGAKREIATFQVHHSIVIPDQQVLRLFVGIKLIPSETNIFLGDRRDL